MMFLVALLGVAVVGALIALIVLVATNKKHETVTVTPLPSATPTMIPSVTPSMTPMATQRVTFAPTTYAPSMDDDF